ncbi:MAG: radical SAM protein [Candidatus Omnitrophota bacterium]
MNILKIVRIFFKVKFFRNKIPIFVGWDLTYRCNFNCQYCKIPKLDTDRELSTDKVLKMIDQFSKLGVCRIHFGGGEVLLRDDLDQILKFCKKRNIYTVILTNGALFEAKIPVIKKANLIKVSFDGPAKIHDNLRHKGSYSQIVKVLVLAKKLKIKVTLSATLTRKNYEYIDYILDFAKENRTPVKFQLVNEFLSGSKDIANLKLSREQQQKAMGKLLKEKKRSGYIINSKNALEYMRDYPNVKNLCCTAGKLYVRVSVDGRLYPCEILKDEFLKNTSFEKDIGKSFKVLKNVNCKYCLCTTTLELNQLFSLNLNAIFNGLKYFS